MDKLRYVASWMVTHPEAVMAPLAAAIVAVIVSFADHFHN